MCVAHVCQLPTDVREGVGSLGTEFTGIFEITFRCWEPSAGSLQVQEMLLATEPSLQPQQRVL